MKSEVVTKLPLPRFFELMGVNPLHAMGVQIAEIETALCQQAWFQFEWQNADQVSREEIARVIREAEDEIESYLGYRLLPSWEEEEWANTIRPRQPEQVWLGNVDVRGLGQAVETRWKHVISGGRRAKDLVEAATAITYSSNIPPDSYDETATVSVTVAEGVAACELAVFYPGKNGDDRYRFRPIEASIIGTTATITFRRELAVLEAEYESIASGGDNIRPVAGTNDAAFLETVDVYRIYNDGETQATLLWMPPAACATCGGNGCDACQIGSQTGCLVIRDPRMGFAAYHPATWNATTGAFTVADRAVGRQPEAVQLYYYAGLMDRDRDCPLQEPSTDWGRTVAILAASRLQRPLCECARRFAEKWQTDFAQTTETSSFSMSPDQLRNPFGTRAGEIYAWQRVSRPGARVAASA